MATAAEDPTLSAAARNGGAAEELRKARAEVARLKLELRGVSRKAEAAEQAQATNESTADDDAELDLVAARGLLASSLASQVDVRRAELAAELAEARSEATRLIESAHRRAEEYVSAAHDVAFAAVVSPQDPVGELSPLPLEVVPDAEQPAPEIVSEPTVLMQPPSGNAGFEAIVTAMQAYLTHAAVVPQSVAAPARSVRPPRPPLRTRVLHADVLLPLIAVVAVLIILIAWVG
jgi:hypothetical protein